MIDPEGVVEDAPVLHDGMGHNLGADRHFRYGDPEAAFAADRTAEIKVAIPAIPATDRDLWRMAEYDPRTSL